MANPLVTKTDGELVLTWPDDHPDLCLVTKDWADDEEAEA